MVATAAPSYAQTQAPPAGAAALVRARAAWNKGDFDIAEPLYKKAITDGGLTREDVVDAYVHVGAARAILGKTKPALEAFRSAATIDLEFAMPPEAGKKADKLAQQAKRERARFGALALTATVPATAPAGSAIGVDATLDAAHVTAVTKVRLVARDPLTSKSYSASEPPSVAMHFDVPAALALPSASLVVRVDALDGHDNRLATSESKVDVGAAVVASSDGASTGHDEPGHASHSGGFWSSAWPWVIGGAVVAGATGSAAWYFTRSTDDVSVGAPRVQALR